MDTGWWLSLYFAILLHISFYQSEHKYIANENLSNFRQRNVFCTIWECPHHTRTKSIRWVGPWFTDVIHRFSRIRSPKGINSEWTHKNFSFSTTHSTDEPEIFQWVKLLSWLIICTLLVLTSRSPSKNCVSITTLPLSTWKETFN